jgi:hypothetical protein
MQTFLPYPSIIKSASVLDWRRLGKQRSETEQIHDALCIPGVGWDHHPATRMWKGHEDALCVFGILICEEWIRRGNVDNMLRRFRNKLSSPNIYIRDWVPNDKFWPSWFGSEELHLSHRSNLLRKDPIGYRFVFPTEPDNLPYVWPV